MWICFNEYNTIATNYTTSKHTFIYVDCKACCRYTSLGLQDALAKSENVRNSILLLNGVEHFGHVKFVNAIWDFGLIDEFAKKPY